jgi:hypothetical protein
MKKGTIAIVVAALVAVTAGASIAATRLLVGSESVDRYGVMRSNTVEYAWVSNAATT